MDDACLPCPLFARHFTTTFPPALPLFCHPQKQHFATVGQFASMHRLATSELVKVAVSGHSRTDGTAGEGGTAGAGGTGRNTGGGTAGLGAGSGTGSGMKCVASGEASCCCFLGAHASSAYPFSLHTMHAVGTPHSMFASMHVGICGCKVRHCSCGPSCLMAARAWRGAPSSPPAGLLGGLAARVSVRSSRAGQASMAQLVRPRAK